MNKELILKMDVLDIIFENRNKDYGAYNLRKYYDQRMNKAVGIMLFLALLFVAFSFLPSRKIVDTMIYTINDTQLANATTPKKLPDEKPKIKTAVQPTTPTRTSILNSILKIVPNTDSTKNIDEVDKYNIGSNIPGNTTIGGPSLVIPAGGGSGENGENVKPVIDRKTIIDNPDIMPSYPGGMSALYKFLQKNLNNPKEMESGEIVNVKVKFVVGYDGKLQSFVTVQDGGEEFNNEVIRVLKKMPEWIPGKSNGQNVSVYYTIPVKFVPAD